jgi:D-glycero-alpha-D-manno-heptose-7-phosphate kinase
MIISRTPLRVSFVGGGTDLPSFCEKERGSVVSTSIKKYIYIIIHDSFEEQILLSYSKIETVDSSDVIQNTRIKEAMKMTGVSNWVEIHSIAEVPAGTGLGSSSSFTVGLLNALYAYKGKHVSAERLAREASEIEIKILKENIGRQDQYAAAFGGLNKIDFINESVSISSISLKKEKKKELENKLMLFFLGDQRNAANILENQGKKLKNNPEISNAYRKMRDLADELQASLYENSDKFGEILKENWILKQGLYSEISNEKVNKYYNIAINAGAKSGKLLGAGGSGFLLFYVEESKQEMVRNALADLKELDLGFDTEGSKIIYSEG